MDAERKESVIKVNVKEVVKNIKENPDTFSDLTEGFLRSMNELSREYLEGVNNLFVTYKDVAAFLGLTIVVGGAFTREDNDNLCVGGVIGGNPEEVMDRLKLYVRGLRKRESRGEFN